MPIIPTTWFLEIRKIYVISQHGPKVRVNPSQPIAGHGATYLRPIYARSINRRLMVQAKV
jgi:hypothetical protein